VNPDAQITSSIDNAEVCIDGSVTLTASLTGGSSTATLQWQNSANSGGPFTDISGATNVTYNPPTDQVGVLYYRVRVIDTSSDCADPSSNENSVSVNEDAAITASSDNAEICVGGTAILTASLSGGSSGATLQWQSGTSTSGPWTDISGATNTTYSVPSGVAGTYYFQVVVSDNNSGCATPSSNPVTVIIQPDAQISASANNSTVCVGGDATLTAVLTGGSTGSTVQWQSGTSTTGPWTDINNATNLVYVAPTGAAGTFFYRIRVIDPNNGCAIPNSTAITVIVTPDPTISASVNNPEVCIGGNATMTAALTGGSPSARPPS
jgi:hypothetical protein